MNPIFQICQNFFEITNTSNVLIFLQFISFSILSYLLLQFFKQTDKSLKISYSFSTIILFLIPIIAILIENINSVTYYTIPKTCIFYIFSCLAWITSCFKFHSFLLFLEKLIDKNAKLRSYHYVLFGIELILCFCIIFDQSYRVLYGIKIYYSTAIYYAVIMFWILSIIPSFFTILKKLSDKTIPFLIKEQLKTLLCYFLLPYLLSILIEFAPFLITGQSQIIAFTNISLILITASIYYCFKKIMQFRFLNVSDHVQIQTKIDITTDFKQVIEQINVASTNQELQYITKQFCAEQLQKQQSDIQLFIRSQQTNHTTDSQIEHFLVPENKKFNPTEMLFQHKILVRHEIEFDEFYTNNEIVVCIAQFLRTIHCDIFIPIFYNKTLLGYIVVSENPERELYSTTLQNQLMVFAQFLASTLYFIQQKDTYSLLHETKSIKEELISTKQEILQYKESLKTLLKDRIENHIGIIFYKNGQFTFKNQQAQNLLIINPNIQPDHPISITLGNFAEQIEKYQTAQTMTLTLVDGSNLFISGMPQTAQTGGCLFLIRKPEATDIIRMQMDTIKNISEYDYLLYLQTTKAGQAINVLFPSNHELFLNIKIQLLKSALQSNTIVLQMHNDDVDNLTSIMHKISNKAVLNTIQLASNKDSDAIALFGINPLLSNIIEPCLLEKSHMGTLIIKNIEYLQITTQQKLAHYIRYGIFTPIKSEQRKFCNTRIICTSAQNLEQMYQEGILIPELYQELHKNTVIIPSLVTLPESDLEMLIDGFVYQHMQQSLIPVRGLVQSEKINLIARRIPSLFALEQKIKILMSQPNEQLQLSTESKKDLKGMDYATSTEIQLAAQLGKHALKDVQLMKSLWKLLGNQTKIADLLGVNRSSVNRRCKEYNLM